MAFRILIYCLYILAAFHYLLLHGVGAIDIGLGFFIEPRHITVLRGKPLTLNCSAFSGQDYGAPNITWQHEGRNINDARRYVLPNGSLHFEKVIHQVNRGVSDEGWYACVAKNHVGALISRLARLSIANFSNQFVTVPQPVTVTVGSVARFSCHIDASPQPSISWEKDRQKLESDSRITVLPSGVLQIHDVKKSDAGKYRCVASNMAGRRRSPAAQLTVSLSGSSSHVPTLLSPPIQELVKKVHETAILECLASGNSKPSLIWTRKDGAALPDQRISQIGQGTLVISNLAKEDAGVYVCTVSSKDLNTNEITKVSQTTRLRVLVPPKIVVKPESIVKLMAVAARFKCVVEGSPTPTVVWLKDGKPLQINGRIKIKGKNMLFVSQTVASDAGIYQCVASNRAGTATAAARFHVNTSTNQPMAPESLIATTVSSTSILVSWDNSYSPRGLVISAYSIHCFPTQGGDEIQRVSVNTSQLLTNLEPFTNYTFYVRAYNAKGASPQSSRVYQVTGQDVPIGAPSISVTSKNPTSIQISWDTLDRNIARGHIVAHKIYYRRNGEASHHVIDVIGQTREFTITELQPGEEYDVKVLAGTKVGFPILSDDEWPWVTHPLPKFMSKEVPPTPALNLSSINSSTIAISWQDGDGQQAVHGYKLHYRKQSHILQGPITLPPSTSSYILRNLEPHSWYEVHFVAFNQHGDGPEAVRNILTLSDDNSSSSNEPVVEPPHHLEAFPLSKSSIKLSWQPPNTEESISYYTISYHVAQTSSKDIKPLFMISNTDEVVIDSLKPFTLYEFSVQSHNEDDVKGPFSHKVQCRTKEAVPSAPKEVSWKVIDKNRVRISWQPPNKPNGDILNYHILYSSNSEDMIDHSTWQSVLVTGDHLKATLPQFDSNVLYYVMVKAETLAGIGKASSIVTLSIPAVKPSHNMTSVVSETTTDAASNQKSSANPSLGIIVGISIGVICIVICILVIVCRSRCCPPTTQPMNGNVTYVMCKENGHIPMMNGNGFLKNGKCHESHEMESYAPMLITTIPDTTISEGPLDTKGGYPANAHTQCGIAKTDGWKKQNGGGIHAMGNGHVVNGGHNSTTNHKPQVNITENPQYNGDVRKDNPEENKDVPRPCENDDDDDECSLGEEQQLQTTTDESNKHPKLDNSSTPLLSMSQCSQEVSLDAT